MNNIDERLKLLGKRHSVRSYKNEPVSEDIINRLKAEVTMITTHEQGLKFQIKVNDPIPFKGFTKSYGTFINAMNYMAAVADMWAPDVEERAGYYAEQFAIKAVELGLGTCFVGGTYDPNSVDVQISAGEKLLFIVLFGYPLEKVSLKEKIIVNMIHLKKMTPEDFFQPKEELPKADEQFPLILTKGLEAVAMAPSAVNRRPVRIFMKEDADGVKLCARVDDSNHKNLIDLGIAKFNFNYATFTQCEWGNGNPIIVEDPDHYLN